MIRLKTALSTLLLVALTTAAAAATAPSMESFPTENNQIKFTTDKKFTRTIYIDAEKGSDKNNGSSERKAIKTLDKLAAMGIENGWQILLKGGQRHKGTIELRKLDNQNSNKLIHIGSYGEGKATLDAAGYANGVYIFSSSNIAITDLKITANGSPDPEQHMLRESDEKSRDRIGVQIHNGWYDKNKPETKPRDMKNILIYNVDFYDIYYYNKESSDIPTNRPCRSWSEPSVRYGYAVRGTNQAYDTKIEGVTMEDCTVRNVSNMGVQLGGNANSVFTKLRFTGCNFEYTGGPGYMFANCTNSVLERSRTYNSGSADDPRKWGRGSGMWLMNCDGFLIERNHFEGAAGIGDSCGAHIDHGNRNVTIQYCVSRNNAGGFVEVLGKNRNCSYRYNVSIDDGWRNSKKFDPVQSEKYWAGTSALTLGTLVSVSGYTGKEFIGPYQTYIYNNTVISTNEREDGFINPFVFQITTSATGVLVANNIFYFPQKLYEGWSGHFATKDNVKRVQNKAFDFKEGYQDGDKFGVRSMGEQKIGEMDVVIKNNLYKLYDPQYPNAENALPTATDDSGARVGYLDSNALGGDPKFVNPDGKSLEDLIPQDRAVIERGIKIEKLKSDETSYGLSTLISTEAKGSELGLEMKYDILGNKITTPIIGAINPR